MHPSRCFIASKVEIMFSQATASRKDVQQSATSQAAVEAARKQKEAKLQKELEAIERLKATRLAALADLKGQACCMSTFRGTAIYGLLISGTQPVWRRSKRPQGCSRVPGVI